MGGSTPFVQLPPHGDREKHILLARFPSGLSNIRTLVPIKIVILQKPMFRCILIFVVLSYMEEIWLRTILSYS